MEPVAIVGMACRFPGADSVAAFWRLLSEGRNAIREVPRDRWNLEHYYSPGSARPGKMSTRWGGFLDGIDLFDPQFFRISPREAARMDPQQRLLLEVALEALEDAGQPTAALAGSDTGVFVGVSTSDYGHMQLSDPALGDPYVGTGSALSIAANRLSYFFDFRGPSIAIDTACSSSLVAVHLACKSLRDGDTSLAIAGGANVILDPAVTVNFSQAGFMSPDGQCKTFDASANGYVRSEGAGMLVLKLLSRALQDGDPVYAIIRGSAVNQDGRSNGLTAPNRWAQEAVLKQAYLDAGVAPGQIQYVECHGTGTALGDPIEAKALGAVLMIDREPQDKCAVGSVKTNIGHMEAAAGMGGLIKAALSLSHRTLLPSLHFERPNPYIPFDTLPLRVQTRLEAWPTRETPLLAGVSSFGFGGTNAHVVLQAAPAPPARAESEKDAGQTSRAHLLALSAHTPGALRARVRQFAELLTDDDGASLDDLCYTAGVRRSHHDFRLAVVGHSRQEVLQQLERAASASTKQGSSVPRQLRRTPKPVFVFSGQGGQWLGMGRELLQKEPVFRAVVEECDALIAEQMGWSLLGELWAGEDASRLQEIDVTVPAIFAIQVGLAALWRSWGVEPTAVIGHSMGEIAAAHVAGVLSLRDAVRVICTRSVLLRRVRGQGGMMAVQLPRDAAREMLAPYEGRLWLAISNSPVSVVVGGEHEALAELQARLQSQNTFCRMVKMEAACHTPQMEPICADFSEAIAAIRPSRARTPIYSGVTGESAAGERMGADHWVHNLREPVLFAEAVQQLIGAGSDTFLEVGPHPIVASLVQQGLDHAGRAGRVLPSMRRNGSELDVMLGSLGALYELGYAVEWKKLYPRGGRCVQLPGYPFQRERCWVEQGATSPGAMRHPASDPRARESHSMLGSCLRQLTRPNEYVWNIDLQTEGRDPRLVAGEDGEAILHPAALLDWALAAAVEAFGAGVDAIERVDLAEPVRFAGGAAPAMQLLITREQTATARFRFVSAAPSAEDRWALHASGTIRLAQVTLEQRASGAAVLAIDEVRARCPDRTAVDNVAATDRDGTRAGDSQPGLKELWRGSGEGLGRLQLPETSSPEPNTHRLHPALLDCCCQVLTVAGSTLDLRRTQCPLPAHIRRLRVYRQASAATWIYCVVKPRGPLDADHVEGDLCVLDNAGQVAMELSGLELTGIRQEDRKPGLGGLIYAVEWEELLAPLPQLHGEEPGRWLLFADRPGIAEGLSQRLRELGEVPISVSVGREYEACGDHSYRLNPVRPEGFQLLISELSRPGLPALRGIVHLWSLDTPAEEFDAAFALGCGSVLHLVQALGNARDGLRPRLWLVTRGAQEVPSAPRLVSPAQGPMWGLGRVLAREHPELRPLLVDLDPEPDGDGASCLWQELGAGDTETQVAWRGRTRYGARLRKAGTETAGRSKRQSSLRSDGTYLITGGLGGLGLVVAQWLVSRGARHLALVGRSRPSEEAQRVVDRLRQTGAQVVVVRADVSRELELADAVAELERTLPPLRGAIHAAGTIDGAMLLQLDDERFRAIMRPKVEGAWNLHKLTSASQLDFFLLFSSAAALLGSPGMAHYAAANAFLDALASHRAGAGLPALSVNWGPWGGAGMSVTTNSAERLRLQGLLNIEPDEGIELLDELLSNGEHQATVMRFDPQQWRTFYPADAHSPFIGPILGAREDAVFAMPDTALPAGGETTPLQRIRSAGPALQASVLRDYLVAEVARVLKLPIERVDCDQPLNNMGLDSLMAVELWNRIIADLAVAVPAVSFLDGASIRKLELSIAEEIGISSHTDDSGMRLGDVPQAHTQESRTPTTATLSAQA